MPMVMITIGFFLPFAAFESALGSVDGGGAEAEEEAEGSADEDMVSE